MLYLLHEAPPEEQTMEMMLTMLEYGAAKEGMGTTNLPWIFCLRGWPRRIRTTSPCGSTGYSSRLPARRP